MNATTERRVSTRTVLVVGLLVALLLAGVVSLWASASPDGLNRVAGDLGFAGAEQASGAQDGPLAGYEVAGVDSPLVRRRRRSDRVPGRARVHLGPDAAAQAVDTAHRRGRVTMGAPHGHRLHFHGHSPLHRAPAHLKVAALVTFMLVVVATPAAWVPAFVAYAVVLAVAGRALRRPRGLPRPPDGRRDAGPGVRGAAALRRHRTRGRGARRRPERARPGGRRRARHQGHPRRARQPAPGRDHGPARPARRARAAAGADPARADHGLHDPLPRRGDRRAAPDEDRARVPRVHRPRPAPLARRGEVGRRPVHPLLRARRAGAPRDDLARLRRQCTQGHGDDHPTAPRPGARPAVGGVRLPRRPPGALRRRPPGPARRTRRRARSQRCRQDHPRAAPQRHPAARRGNRDRVRPARGARQPPGDPPSRGHRLPGPRRPALHGQRARGRRLRSPQPRRPRCRARPAG